MKREEMKKLKGDEFISGFGHVLDFIKTWRQEVLIGLVALAGLVILGSGLLILKNAQARSASASLGRILDLRAGLEQTPANIAQLEVLSRKGKFARVALNQLASYWIEKGELDKAAGVLAGLKESPKDFFYFQAKDLAAQVALLKGDADGALKILKAIEDAKPKDFTLDAILFHKAEALEKKGDRAAALEVFKKIQADYAQSYYGYDAGLRARKLETAK
jgi:predicted negative regulator of RcsB-dependent stress response